MSGTYRIWHASGEPYESRDRVYTPAEAAGIVAGSPLAVIDDDGDIELSTYRIPASDSSRQEAKRARQVHGRVLARRLARLA